MLGHSVGCSDPSPRDQQRIARPWDHQQALEPLDKRLTSDGMAILSENLPTLQVKHRGAHCQSTIGYRSRTRRHRGQFSLHPSGTESLGLHVLSASLALTWTLPAAQGDLLHIDRLLPRSS